jgi:hypothetical protein
VNDFPNFIERLPGVEGYVFATPAECCELPIYRYSLKLPSFALCILERLVGILLINALLCLYSGSYPREA